MSVLILTAKDVEIIAHTLNTAFLCDLMGKVFAYLSSETLRANDPLRSSILTDNHNILFMPSRLHGTGTAIKVVSVPSSPDDRRGLPATTLVLDDSTGAVKAVVNARHLTALRNAGSLLATTLVGPSAPKHVVAFGAGNQIRAHLELYIKAYKSIESCKLIVRAQNERVASLLKHLRLQFADIDFHSILSLTGGPQLEVKVALFTAHIIICATPSRTPLFPSSWIRSGTHLILIGSYTKDMHEIDDTLLLRATPKLLVDSRSACLAEAGEVINAGLRSEDMSELGELVMTPETWTSLDQDASDDLDGGPVTIYKSVGVGLQDVAIACAVVNKAQEMLMSGEKIGVLVDNYE